MPLNTKIQVDIPAHCVKVPKGEHIYIQYTQRAYRNENGKSTSKRVAIGKLDTQTGKLIPNRNYYEIFEKDTELPMPELVQSCGEYAAFSGVAKKLGVDKLLRRHFHEKADAILTVAQYMLSEGNVMFYLSDWQDENLTYSKRKLSGADLSRLFASIGQSERLSFFNDWIKSKYDKEYIAYDVTSISTYSKGIEDAEWGYNRDKEKLPQLNLGMYYGEETKLPLYYRLYPGSIPDKAHLKYMINDNSIVACKKARFVMDRGFYSAENLQFLTREGYRFLIALPQSLKYVRELIDKHRADIINKSECWLGAGKPYGKAYEVTELGFRMMVHLYYDPAKAAKDSENLQGEIQRLENELNAMEEPPDKKKHYDKYFFVNRSKDGKLGFRRNAEAIDRELSRCGFFLIAETDFVKSTADILDTYRRRDVVEKSFDSLKNDLDMRRLYVHSDETAEGKLFCAFISLIIHSYMQNKLQAYIDDNKLTFRKILLELNKIKRIISAKSRSGSRLLNPATKTLRDIFRLLEVENLQNDFV